MTRRVDPSESQLPMVRESDQTAIVPHGEASVDALLQTVAARGGTPEELEKWFSLYERVNEAKARKAFEKAFGAFKAECPPIPRRTQNTQFKKTRVMDDGRSVTGPAMYAALEDIEATIRPVLGAHGLSYRWGDSVVANNSLTIACIAVHVDGHSISSSASYPVESRAGCSEQQKYASAESYAMRRSLIRVLGLTTCDEDMDGNAPDADVPKITEHQAANIEALLAELGPLRADRAKFLAWVPAPSIAEIPASEFKRCVAKLESKRKEGAE